MAAVAPETCFKTSGFINDKKSSVSKDSTKWQSITNKHVLVKVKACFTDTQIVGARTTFGIWSGGKITKEVKLNDHGIMVEDSALKIDCSSADIKEGDRVTEMTIYSTETALTRIRTKTAKGSTKDMGPSSGTKNSGVIPFASTRNKIDSVWGFAG